MRREASHLQSVEDESHALGHLAGLLIVVLGGVARSHREAAAAHMEERVGNPAVLGEGNDVLVGKGRRGQSRRGQSSDGACGGKFAFC